MNVNDAPQDPVEQLRSMLGSSVNLQEVRFPSRDGQAVMLYVDVLVNQEQLDPWVREPLFAISRDGVPFAQWPLAFAVNSEMVQFSPTDGVLRLLKGETVVLDMSDSRSKPNCLYLKTANDIGRNPAKADIETQIIGPQVAFTESLDKNMAMILGYLPDPRLQIVKRQIGRRTRTQASILYLNDVAIPEVVQTVLERIDAIDVDGLIDSAMLLQLIDDKRTSIFPQLITTERPDRVVSGLLEGMVTILIDGSPFVVMGPCHLFDFFRSMEDQYIRWNMASFLKLLRLGAALISVLFTPLYVASVTYHYEVIPPNMLVSLAQSRSRVPFPPLMEALFLEFIIELLREAGARLPTKVGQTMGIVGGIVIGQAAVQAGFTSNILIIIIALGALASFITPVYMMGAAIRILRFPMILLAGTWGAFGIMIGMCFLILHLLKLSSIGRPYLYPIFPFRPEGMKDTIVRFPLHQLVKRSAYSAQGNRVRLRMPQKSQPPDIYEVPDVGLGEGTETGGEGR